MSAQANICIARAILSIALVFSQDVSEVVIMILKKPAKKTIKYSTVQLQSFQLLGTFGECGGTFGTCSGTYDVCNDDKQKC